MSKLYDTLRERGFVYQFSSETLEEITDPIDGSKRTIYLGVDPTADSIHAGNFAVYMLLRHFVDAGHKVVLLIGGGTGMIGDPKPDVERPLTPPEVVAERAAKLAMQAKQILGSDVEIVNNYDWLGKINLIDFLRDIGKHFTVNNLMKKDAIAKRLASDEGITYTEFAYPLLQAYDFWHLFKTRGVNVQVSGSDQWGNITSGIDLIRRKESAVVYGLTIPLITDKSTGKKFGKSEGNAVWLDPNMTSPFQFYQFWLNTSDESVEDYLKIFTRVSLEEVSAVTQEQIANPGARVAQKKLAYEVTKIVHGEIIAGVQSVRSDLLFAVMEDNTVFSSEIIEILKEMPYSSVNVGDDLLDVLVLSQLASSKREARQFLADGAISMNGVKILESRSIEGTDFRDEFAILKRGKKNVAVLKLSK